MANELSKSQVDRLGDRLRKRPIAESDLIFLDEYRRSFFTAYEFIVRTIRAKLKLEPTGRPAKSTSSVVEKLQRESIRLSQIQDIAGCRIVVQDILAQEEVAESLLKAFPEVTKIDRRSNPSYGYRAVHIVARHTGKLIEIQIRSTLQHLWAEFSEKLSDVVDPAIKYGGGPDEIKNYLLEISSLVFRTEKNELDIAALEKQGNIPKLDKLRDKAQDIRADITRNLKELIDLADQEKRGK